MGQELGVEGGGGVSDRVTDARYLMTKYGEPEPWNTQEVLVYLDKARKEVQDPIFEYLTVSTQHLLSRRLLGPQIVPDHPHILRLYFLLIAGLVRTCAGLSWAEKPYNWPDPHVLGTFIVGIVFCAARVTYEWKFTSADMFHHALSSSAAQTSQSPSAPSLSKECSSSVPIITSHTRSRQCKKTDRLIITTRYSITFILALFAITAGAYCLHFRIVRLPNSAAFLSFIIFFVLMATSSPKFSQQVWGYPEFLGLGLGVCLNTLVTAAQFFTPPELISLASGLIIGVRSFGNSIGLAIYNTIFATTISRELVSRMPNAVVPAGLPASDIPKLILVLTGHNSKAVAAIPGMTPEIARMAEVVFKDAHMVAFRWVWVLVGSFAFVALIWRLFLQNPKKEFNEKIDAPAETEDELYRR